MKRSFLLHLGLAALLVALGATGCKRPEKGVTPIAGRQATAVDPRLQPQPPIQLPGTGGLGTDRVMGEDLEGGGPMADRDLFEGYLMDTERFAAQTVYFDFDSSVVKMSEIDKVQAVAAELKLRPQMRLLVDGHCDERGTEEYNRALGERRALSVRQVLASYGVDPQRVRTRSWGEDKPADPRSNEEAWAKNRRGEFILLIPPTQ